MSKTIKEKNNNEYYQKLQDIKKPLILQNEINFQVIFQHYNLLQ